MSRQLDVFDSVASLHCGWLSNESAKFLCNVIEHFGRPTKPITISRNRHIEQQAEVNVDNHDTKGVK